MTAKPIINGYLYWVGPIKVLADNAADAICKVLRAMGALNG